MAIPKERRSATLPPSLTDFAVTEIRAMILAGTLGPGERLVEERLTEHLGISRPPLREAMRILESEGLVESRERRGSWVASMSDQDVYEILTLRAALERMAVELGVPVTAPERLAVVEERLEAMQARADAGDRAGMVQAGYDFHSAVVALAGHSRLNSAYESVHQQVLLCMARNLVARDHQHESLQQNVERHRTLVDLIKKGDPGEVLTTLANHGRDAFTRE